MIKISVLGLAAATLLPFTVTADAYSKRLNFGGPLGTFTASSNPGGYSGTPYGAKKCPPKTKQYASRKPSVDSKPRVHAARHVEKSEPRVAKHVERKEVRVAARADKPTKQIEKSIVQAPAETVAKITAVESAATQSQTTASGSQALAAGSLPASEPLEVSKLSPEVIPAVPAPDAIQAETQDAAPEAAKVAMKTESVAAAGPADCKKFIPAVGVTVTVGCEK